MPAHPCSTTIRRPSPPSVSAEAADAPEHMASPEVARTKSDLLDTFALEIRTMRLGVALAVLTAFHSAIALAANTPSAAAPAAPAVLGVVADPTGAIVPG